MSVEEIGPYIIPAITLVAGFVVWSLKIAFGVRGDLDKLIYKSQSRDTEMIKVAGYNDKIVVLETNQTGTNTAINELKAEIHGIRDDIKEAGKEHSNALIQVLESLSDLKRGNV